METASIIRRLRKPSVLIQCGIWAFLLFLLSQRIPGWVANYRVEGVSVVPSFAVLDAQSRAITLPLAGEDQIIVFWATWCKPCEIELDRFNRAVKDKDIRGDRILAVSLGEDPLLVYAEAKARDYAFTVLVDPKGLSARALDVQGTPQVYHIDRSQRVAYASMGLSPLSIFRARRFLSVSE